MKILIARSIFLLFLGPLTLLALLSDLSALAFELCNRALMSLLRWADL